MEAHASPRVTAREKMSIVKERLLHGRSSNESEEFLEAFEKLVRLRSQLRTVERGVKKWLVSSRALAKSALFLAQAVDTDKETYFQLSSDMEAELKDTATLKAIAKKLSMLDTLVRDRTVLVDLRHLKNRASRKVKSVLARDSDDESKRRALGLEDAYKARYEEHYAQLLAAMRFVVGEADERGHCALIAPELSAFKLFQFQFFLNAQKIIQGSHREDAGDLDEEWSKFTVELSAERQRAQSALPPPRASGTAAAGAAAVGSAAVGAGVGMAARRDAEDDSDVPDSSDEELEDEEDELSVHALRRNDLPKAAAAAQAAAPEEAVGHDAYSDDEDEDEEKQDVRDRRSQASSKLGSRASGRSAAHSEDDD